MDANLPIVPVDSEPGARPERPSLFLGRVTDEMSSLARPTCRSARLRKRRAI